MAADTQVLLVGGGAVAIGGAVIWRILARHVEISRLLRRLRDTRPVERARGGNALVDLGLRRAAPPILQAMATEPDPRVRRSVALAIARRQWEPAGPTRVARLRQWASEELNRQGQRTQEFGPAVTRLSDMGGPRLLGPNGNGGPAAPPPAAEPALAPPPPAPLLEPEPTPTPAPAAAPAAEPEPAPTPQPVPLASPPSTPGQWATDRSVPAPDPGLAPAPLPEPAADPAPPPPEPPPVRPGSSKKPGWWADPGSAS
jgi:hypothetical protein